MKIRFKGLAKLFKAIPNRAHLFPVKVLVNGKNKSFYAIRYKTGNKAMEIVLKQMRIPNDREALFDSKDGKAKNLSEKDVLEIYSKAGKPGSLNEFIQANFKKPIIKPRNSSIVDLDNKQMSIDDLMQGNKKEQKPESGITITGPIYDDDERPTYYINDNGNVIETQDSNLVEQYRKKQKEVNNQAGTDDKDNNQSNDNEGEENLGKENKKPQNEITDPKQIIIDKLQQKGAFIWEKGGYERLYFNEVGKEVADRIAKEEGISKESSTYKALGYFTNKMYLNLKDGKVYIPSNGSKGYKLESKYSKKIVQYVKELPKNIDTTSNENVKLLSAEGEEKLLQAIGGKVCRGNPYRAYIDPLKMQELAIPEDKKNPWTSGAISRRKTLEDATINLITGEITPKKIYGENIIPKAQEVINNLISEIKTETEGSKPEENQKTPEQQDKELKDKRAKQQSKEMQFERELIDEGDYGKIRKFGTKKIISKGEYPKAKNLDDFVKRTKAVKDFHLDIKGRAILDMFGIEAPLFNKRNGRPLSLDRYTKVSGYCSKNAEGETLEIALVAETGDNVRETKTTIHECMHSKLRNSISEAMEGLKFKNYIAGENIRGYIEETIVEMAGQGVSNLIHGNETDKQRWSYEGIVARAIPAILGVPEFKGARKNGLHGIGQEICKNLMSGNREFIQNVVNRYIENPEISKYIKTPIENKSGDMIEKRMKAIETKVLERTDKVEKIKNDTRRSGIANLVEELKRGTISLEGALNSEKYKEIAAILITKFLEDEDLEALEGLALSF
ncbi:hypothetical protein NH288_08605 [Anaerococcus sp. NML200537]|uniref:hypothetical protein n=1 Tax=Anaerococcus sp. NML200537 TaxID=2954485 RepID=UPI00223907DE|nr:hypothetical protein [Anaerococcus sp. NML200537]MCW6702146.1 hypothetical protein [Anaerococcus sp. NML200537]